MVRLGHTILLGLGPQAQVEATYEDPQGPSSQLCHPRLHPTACPECLHAGQDERRHSASPQPLPAPNTGSLFRKARRRGGKVSTCQPWRGGAGVSPARNPSQPAQASQPDRRQQGQGAVPSQLAWETSRGASTGPSSGTWRRGAGRPGGHEGVSC